MQFSVLQGKNLLARGLREGGIRVTVRLVCGMGAGRKEAAMQRTRCKTIWIATVMLAGAGAAYAADGGRTPVSPEFARLDANRDGFLTRDETHSLADFDQPFREADDNRDGKLDGDEFTKAQAIYERLRAERYLDDSLITAKVKAALLKELRLKGLDVKVETRGGTVVLSGTVNDGDQARRAAEIAAGVEGVSAVRNTLVVKGGSIEGGAT
jgi:hyperosmotically inducible protein